jgi:type II secretory pathway component PulK
MSMSNEISTDVSAAAQAWVEQFGSAALSPTHAASLIESSLATVRVVADAAQSLDWLDADAFTHTLKNLEPGHAR